jgi:hypothetical protein
MISYDHIDLPLALVRRIIAWQQEYDGTLEEVMLSKASSCNESWTNHDREEYEIALELQNTLGSSTVVQVAPDDKWIPITTEFR